MKSEARALYLLKNLIREMAHEISEPKKKILKESSFSIDPATVSGYEGDFVEDRGLGNLDPSTYYWKAVEDIVKTSPERRDLKAQFAEYFKFLEEFYASYVASQFLESNREIDPMLYKAILPVAKHRVSEVSRIVSRLKLLKTDLSERDPLFTVKIPEIISGELSGEENLESIETDITNEYFSAFTRMFQSALSESFDPSIKMPVFEVQKKSLLEKWIRFTYRGVLPAGITGEALLDAVKKIHPSLSYSKTETSFSGKYDTWEVKLSPDSMPIFVIFTVSKGGKEGKDPDDILMTGALLGYGAEHATYFALNNYKDDFVRRNMEYVLGVDERSSTSGRLSSFADSRLVPSAKRASIAGIKKFIESIVEMTHAVREKFSQSGFNVEEVAAPKPTTGKYDLEAYGTWGDKDCAVRIHVKYQSDRLVGIQKPPVDPSREPPWDDLSETFNSSEIYHIVRDGLLFGGRKNAGGALDNSGALAGDNDHLTKFGKKVLDKQGDDFAARKRERDLNPKKAKGAPLKPESEISIMMKDSELRSKFLSELDKGGQFTKALERDIKDALDLNPGKGKTSLSLLEVTAFVNFLSFSEVETYFFYPKIDFKMSFTPGSSTGKAFICNVTLPGILPAGSDPGRSEETTINSVFVVELGSIARKKYVQIHKGENYDEFIAAVGGGPSA